MKKNLVIFLFLFSFSLSFAEFNDGKLTKFIEFDLSSSTTRGIEREQTLFAELVGVNSHWFDAIVASQSYKDYYDVNVFDFTIAGETWLPCAHWYFDTARIALGLGVLYHFQRFTDISSEHDFIIDSCFRYQSKSGTTITFRGGYSWKMTRIDALASNISLLNDRYPTAGMLIDKIFANGLEIYFEHAAHDLFRYPIFCMPEYTLGCAMNLDSGLRFGGEIKLCVTDQYTTAPYLEGLILRMTARFLF